MWFGGDEARALEAEAHERLGRGQFEEAEALAERLLALRWSGGFAVKALARERAGDAEGARRTLEGALERVPQAWSLWLLLGNLRSNAGRLDEARDALDRALRCDGVDEATVRFNRAIVEHRRGAPGEALDDLEPILALPRPPEFAEDALALSAECLAEIGRGEEGLAMIEGALEACAAGDPRRPRLHAERAVALDRLGRDPEPSYSAAREAGQAQPALLALARRREPARGGAPKRFRMVVRGAVASGGAEGFFRVYDVVADDAAQALALCVAALPRRARKDVAVEEAQTREDPCALEPGVHAASPLLFFGA